MMVRLWLLIIGQFGLLEEVDIDDSCRWDQQIVVDVQILVQEILQLVVLVMQVCCFLDQLLSL